ncbi:aminoglycoside phosphotransferase family protein [Fictibacillus nanhaiensis]|nr:aminoglycoside phosphotransferase family protein [Fictibacillus nanhaiensis]MBY6037746.1 aminoglycoside phosphotransferase family protein [Fictibacillus nanhaiensis]
MNPVTIDEIPLQFKNITGKINNMTFPKQGYTSDVGILHTDKERYVVKRAKGELFRTWLSQEASVLVALSVTDLSVPRLFHFVSDADSMQSWTLTEHLEGVTLRNYLYEEKDQQNRHKAIYSFGETLAKVHITTCPNELMGDKLWLDEQLENAQFNLENYGTEGTRDLLDKLRRDRPSFHPQTLIHGDFTLDNVLVKDGKVTSIIDWSGGAFGDPRYDVSLAIRPKPNAFETKEDKEMFFAGYGKKIITEADYHYFEEGLYNFF